MRLMALGLLNIAFEVGGRSIGEFPALRMMVADHLCKHLFQVRRLPLTCPCPRGQAADPSLTTVQLARSDNPQLLSTSLRVITNVFDTMRPHLKLQQELFLSFLLDRLILPNAAGIRKADLESQLDLSTWARDSARLRPVPVPRAEDQAGTARQQGRSEPRRPRHCRLRRATVSAVAQARVGRAPSRASSCSSCWRTWCDRGTRWWTCGSTTTAASRARTSTSGWSSS